MLSPLIPSPYEKAARRGFALLAGDIGFALHNLEVTFGLAYQATAFSLQTRPCHKIKQTSA